MQGGRRDRRGRGGREGAADISFLNYRFSVASRPSFARLCGRGDGRLIFACAEGVVVVVKEERRGTLILITMWPNTKGETAARTRRNK